jgi:hypothetical protein
MVVGTAPWTPAHGQAGTHDADIGYQQWIVVDQVLDL